MESLSGRRILIVEDEYFLASDMTKAFAALGAIIIGPAANVEDALALVRATAQLDGAVLDVNLQGELVFPVADALRARATPFVFATGYDKLFLPQRYAEYDRHEKPVDAAKVAEALFAYRGREPRRTPA